MRFAFLALLAVAPAFAAPPPPVAATPLAFELTDPTLEKAAAELRKLTGMGFVVPPAIKDAKVAAKWNGTFWTVAEQLASESKCRLQMQGGQLRFVPAVPKLPPAPSFIDGAFRTSVRQVNAKRELQSGNASTEIHLDVFWEPRFPVYLIDAVPSVTKAAGQKGNYQADAPSGRVSTGNFVHPMTVRLNGVPREELAFTTLSGTFNVIAAEKMLAVEFKDLTSDKPIEQVVEGVKVVLKPVSVQSGLIAFDFQLEYPESHPMFESFQEWAGTNKLLLFDPAGKLVKESNYNTIENGRRIAATYFFNAPKGPLNLKGWRLVYETPSPMVEQKVRFDLKDVVLP